MELRVGASDEAHETGVDSERLRVGIDNIGSGCELNKTMGLPRDMLV
jgi:hypothetical protein